MSKLTVLTDVDQVSLLHTDGSGYALTPVQARELALKLLALKLLAAADRVDCPPSLPGVEVTEFVNTGVAA